MTVQGASLQWYRAVPPKESDKLSTMASTTIQMEAIRCVAYSGLVTAWSCLKAPTRRAEAAKGAPVQGALVGIRMAKSRQPRPDGSEDRMCDTREATRLQP
jgi:hypothetical protein